MEPKILIITHSGDNHCVDRVISHIRENGGKAFRFNSDHYPVFVQLSAQIMADGKIQSSLHTPDYEIDLNELTGIWYRRLRVGDNLGRFMEAQFVSPSLQESNHTLRGAIDSLDVFQLDHYMKHRIAGNKFQQLKLAQKIGMTIPETLMSNQLKPVKAFYQSNDEDIIVKMQSSFSIYDQQGEENVVFTNKVDQNLLEDADALQLCPMKFQINLTKKRELRITVVSDRLFVAAVDSQKLETAKYDWRKEGSTLLNDWYQYNIPKKLESQIFQLMDLYQLNYGAFDFIETPEGEYYFLEVNAGGEFCWLDDLFDQQICRALADTLLGYLPQRSSRFPTF